MEKDLYMKPNVLTEGSHYRLALRGTAHDGAIFEKTFEFIVNKPPEHGMSEDSFKFFIETNRLVTFEL